MIASKKPSLYELVGGKPVLQHVHKVFYDKVYAHPWLSKFFEGHNQQSIENRQTSFMVEKMGGPVNYMGRQPKMAHRAMYITEELFQLRTELLTESLQESGIDEVLIARWIRIDSAFMKQIVKPGIESFYKETFRFEKRRIIPKPN